MLKYEKQLKTLIRLSEGGCMPVFVPDCGIPEPDIRILAGKCWIKLIPAGDDELYAELTGAGLTYFIDRAEDRRDFWKEHLVSFCTGLLIGLFTGGAATALIREMFLQIFR